MPITFERNIQGFGEVRKNLSQFIREYPKAVARAAKAEMTVEMHESQKITPYRSGELHDSHAVIEPEIVHGRIHTGITVGNEKTASYDVIVHEDLEAIHPHGQAKFLEVTWNASAPYIPARIAARVSLKHVLTGTE